MGLVSPTTEREERFARAERLLEEYFEQRARSGESALSFEAFVRNHEELSAELRELHVACGEVDLALLQGQQAFTAQQAQVQEVLEELRSANDFARRYAIEGEVGKGGMGAVFRVVDRTLDRPLAMKVILGQVDAARSGKTPPIAPRQLKRFLNEAKITGQLDHSGIVPVHEVGVDTEGRAYFTMKLVQGRTLGEIFELQADGDSEWTRPRILSLIQRVCEAMAYAHERGVIHRDLKPANVMIGDFGEVYVMDWGLARRISAEEEPAEATVLVGPDPLEAELTKTRQGAVVGTPAYMPPEQAAGDIARMGPHSDVYAIGSMLYHLIAAYPPYCEPGKDTSSTAVLLRIVQGPPKKLAGGGSPPELIAICERAMARQVPTRYPDVRALAADLSAFVAGRVVRAYEVGPWAELKKWILRNKALSAASAAGIVALLAGLVTSLLLKGEADRNVKEAQENAVAAQKNEARALHLAEVARDATLDLVDGLDRSMPHSTSGRLRQLRTQLLGSANSRLVHLAKEPALAGAHAIAARTNLLLARLSRETGEAQEAREYATRALRESEAESGAWDETERLASRARALTILADMDREEGGYSTAKAGYQEALAAARQAGAATVELVVLDRLASLHQLIHEPNAARMIRQEWIELGEALVQLEPDRVEMRLLSARLYTTRGTLAKAAKKGVEAMELLRQGSALLEALYTESPDDPEVASTYTLNLQTLGELLETMGAREESLRILKRGREVCTAYLEWDPENVGVRGHLARVLLRIGMLYSQLGQPEVAAATYREIFDLHVALLPQGDDEQMTWLMLYGGMLGAVASDIAGEGMIEEVIQLLEEAAGASERCSELKPESAELTTYAASMWRSAAEYRQTLQDLAGARQCLERARYLYQRMASAFPDQAAEYRIPTQQVERQLRYLDGDMKWVLDFDLREVERHRASAQDTYYSHFWLTLALYQAGLTAWELERWDEAEDLLLEGLDEGQRAMEFPGADRSSMRRTVAFMSLHVSVFFVQRGKLEEHHELVERALAQSQPFLGDSAEIRDWRARLEGALEREHEKDR